MTLVELSDYICTKSQQVEDADKAACKSFLSKRYELIYNTYLWKDALTMVDLSVDPVGNLDNQNGIVQLPTQIDRVVAIRTSSNAVKIHALEEYFRVDWDRFADTSNTNGLVEFAILNPVWLTFRPSAATAGASVTITSDNSADLAGGATPITIKVTWRDARDRYVVTGTMPMTLTPADASGFIEVESVFKPTSLGNITATLAPNGGTYSTTSGTLLPSAKKSPSYQRVRLFGKPTIAMTLSVLGKKPFVPLDFDNEIPAIRNLDNCLLAFGLADMLQRARQYGKAQSQMQEATVLLTELAKLETMQAANNVRFIPDSGYGDPFFAPSSNRGIWF